MANHMFHAIEAERIEVVSPKTNYKTDEALVPPTVYAYAGDYRRDVTASCSFQGYDASKNGTQTVTVSLGAKSQSYEVNVKTPSFLDNLPIPLWLIIVIGVVVLLALVLFLIFASKKTKKKALKTAKKVVKKNTKGSSKKKK